MDYKNILLGAICGDIIGSFYEWHSTKNYNFELFSRYSHVTDDSVMTVAIADWLMTGDSLTYVMQDWGRRYPRAGYGGAFRHFLTSETPEPYNSFGNGSAMRVSPVGWAFPSLEETLQKAKESAEVSHNHPEGIKGAQATASAIFLARNGKSKEEIKLYIETEFGYNLHRSIEDIRPSYLFDVTCQGSVPEAIICFLESNDYESAIRLAISLGGDADTQAAIAGSIACAFYKEIPKCIVEGSWERIPDDIKEIINKFGKWISEK